MSSAAAPPPVSAPPPSMRSDVLSPPPPLVRYKSDAHLSLAPYKSDAHLARRDQQSVGAPAEIHAPPSRRGGGDRARQAGGPRVHLVREEGRDVSI
jgi:hypothetical protein